MIVTYTNSSQTLSSNDLISFNVNSLSIGHSISHTAGSTSISIDMPGYYLVTFNGTASATGSETSPITVQLYNNSTAVNGAMSSALSSAASTPVNLSFTTIVKVLPSCCVIDNSANLTFSNSGTTAAYSNVNVVITKLT